MHAFRGASAASHRCHFCSVVFSVFAVPDMREVCVRRLLRSRRAVRRQRVRVAQRIGCRLTCTLFFCPLFPAPVVCADRVVRACDSCFSRVTLLGRMSAALDSIRKVKQSLPAAMMDVFRDEVRVIPLC